MSADTSTCARKNPPERLEEALKAIPRFKPAMKAPPQRSVADILGDSTCQAMFDEVLGPLVNKRAKSAYDQPQLSTAADVPTSSSSALSSSGAPDMDFTTRLLIRLSDAEQETKSMRRQLVEKMGRVSVLERENRELRQRLEAPEVFADELQTVKDDNAELRAQIADMEQFLRDYGLVWVGNQGNDDGAGGAGSAADRRRTAAAGVDFKAFAKKIDDLNAMLAAEPAQVKVDGTSRRARLVHADEMFDCVPVAFYRDGILIRRGPFRVKGSESYDSFVRDVMDGYFPSEFQGEFPDGVMFKLVDRHEMDFEADAAAAAEGGAAGAGAGAMGKDQFLRRLPKTVVRGGEIVSVRDDIEAMLGPPGNNGNGSNSGSSSSGAGGKGTTVLQTPAAAAGPGPRPTAAVHVRWLDGTTVVAAMYADDSVGALRAMLVEQCTGAEGAAAFELRAAYPPRALDDVSTMMDAGLCPNGTVHARRI